MPSTPYYSELQSDPRLRRVVVASGVAFAVLGELVIFSLDLGLEWRLAGALLWALSAARELYVITDRYKRFRRVRIDATGEVTLQDSDGEWCSAKLLSGSIVLARFAWLRLAPEQGLSYPEPLRGDASENEAWRRFQVIWRHQVT